ncbi:MAG: wax ester/triacylglycerol synthase family O-acyltransferase [Actinomycetota bacterium]|nr:wax ester/triacylglycerol synthase family O-acyltransferase [Actinomycetota bacterium]
MQQLSPLDAQFLNVESPTTVGHVGSLILLDPSTAPGGELTLDRLREVLEPRLHLAAPLRQRLVSVPLGLGRPYWIDDPDFDIEFHLREIGLPSPGDERQLGEQVARIHARPLDRTRPLWEMYLVHNVSDGRQALYSKVHHAAIDGVSGAEILATIMDVTVEPRVVEPPDEYWSPAPMPGATELMSKGLASMATQPLEVMRTLPRALPHLAEMPGASLVPGAKAVSELADTLVRLTTGGDAGREVGRRTISTPPTPLNAPITAHRRFAYGSLPLDDIKLVKNAYAMTVNDVVMALCTSALRRWLLDHVGLPETPLVVAVPVSVRTDDQAADNGNFISVMLAEMPVHVADPVARLAQVQKGMGEAKEQFEAVPASILQDLAAVIPTALSGLAARAIFQMVAVGAFPFNLFISNVPGPQLPLYVGGASVLGVYPVSAITDLTGALNITLFSYNGALGFGLIACRELVPDVWNLIGYLDDALAELVELADGSIPRMTSSPATPE